MRLMTRMFSAVLLLSAALASPATSQVLPVSAYDPVLEPGDHVELIVWRNPEMSGEFEVAPDSTLGHPILQAVKVGGVKVSTAEERLRVFLGRFEANPQLVLRPRFRVFVGGEVGTPGFHLFSPNVSVAEAVMLAGQTDRSRMDRVSLTREGHEEVVDLTSVDSRHARQLIRSGDQIVVDRRGNTFRDVIMPAVTFIGAVTAVANFVSR